MSICHEFCQIHNSVNSVIIQLYNFVNIFQILSILVILVILINFSIKVSFLSTKYQVFPSGCDNARNISSLLTKAKSAVKC